jgi:hypothetical protein
MVQKNKKPEAWKYQLVKAALLGQLPSSQTNPNVPGNYYVGPNGQKIPINPTALMGGGPVVAGNNLQAEQIGQAMAGLDGTGNPLTATGAVLAGLPNSFSAKPPGEARPANTGKPTITPMPSGGSETAPAPTAPGTPTITPAPSGVFSGQVQRRDIPNVPGVSDVPKPPAPPNNSQGAGGAAGTTAPPPTEPPQEEKGWWSRFIEWLKELGIYLGKGFTNVSTSIGDFFRNNFGMGKQGEFLGLNTRNPHIVKVASVKYLHVANDYLNKLAKDSGYAPGFLRLMCYKLNADPIIFVKKAYQYPELFRDVSAAYFVKTAGKIDAIRNLFSSLFTRPMSVKSPSGLESTVRVWSPARTAGTGIVGTAVGVPTAMGLYNHVFPAVTDSSAGQKVTSVAKDIGEQWRDKPPDLSKEYKKSPLVRPLSQVIDEKKKIVPRR